MGHVSDCMRVCVCVCVRACVRACVCVPVHANVPCMIMLGCCMSVRHCAPLRACVTNHDKPKIRENARWGSEHKGAITGPFAEELREKRAAFESALEELEDRC